MSSPTTPPPPTAAPAACPVCATPYHPPATTRCGGCGIDLSDPEVARVHDIDRTTAGLAAERAAIVARLTATGAGAVQPPPPRPVWERAAPPSDAGPPPTPGPPPPELPPRRRLGVPTVLALGGVALLTAAAAVFTAVAWTTLPALGQAAILLAATGLAAVASVVLDRRQIPTAAGALGVVTMSFAAVDVVGLQRAELVALDAFTVPAAALVAAVVGWALSRAGLRWVSTAGAIAVVVAAAGVTIGSVETFTVPTSVVALVGTLASVGAAATVPTWRTQPARRTAGVGAAGWLTVSGLVGAGTLADGEAGLATGLAVVALPIALLLGAARRTPVVLAPAALLATAATVAAAAHLEGEPLQLAAVAGAAVAALAWGTTRVAPPGRAPLVVGALPAAAATGAVALWALGAAGVGIVATIFGLAWEPIDAWGAVTAVLGGVALTAVPRVRAAVPWVVLAAALTVSAALPDLLAWLSLLAVAAVAAALPAAVRPDPIAVLVAAVAAVGWSAGAGWSLAVAAVATTAVAAWLAVTSTELRSRVSTGVAVAAAGLAVAAGADTAGLVLDLALGAGLIALFAAAVTASLLGRDAPPIAAPIVAAIATVAAPPVATTARAAGLLLIVAASGWLAFAVLGRRFARWAAALVASAGSFVLLGDAGVEVVEAYTLVPALTLAVVGTWWLVEDRSVRTAVALAPALSVGLVPSLVVLTADPQTLGRTLGLTAVAGALALLGIRGRWLAPTVAGALTAVWVAVTQLTIVVEVVPRWVTFGVVGLLLVWLAATYERQQARARTLARRVGAFR